MSRKYAPEYIDRLLHGETYDDLVQLTSAICTSSQYSGRDVDYGLPVFAFVFVETLLWFAQGKRSGVWTYYETAPLQRQNAMAAALRVHAPTNFADWYEQGMSDWEDDTKINAVDEWMRVNENIAHAWLRQLARSNREGVLALT